jgi:hypothetical protein
MYTTARTALLLAQHRHWVDPGRPAGREEVGSKGYRGEEGRDEEEGDGIGGGGPEEQAGEEAGGGQRATSAPRSEVIQACRSGGSSLVVRVEAGASPVESGRSVGLGRDRTLKETRR